LLLIFGVSSHAHKRITTSLFFSLCPIVFFWREQNPIGGFRTLWFVFFSVWVKILLSTCVWIFEFLNSLSTNYLKMAVWVMWEKWTCFNNRYSFSGMDIIKSHKNPLNAELAKKTSKKQDDNFFCVCTRPKKPKKPLYA
jgi:hypothetical protein